MASKNKTVIEGKYTVQTLLETAEKVVLKKTEGSKILDIEAENRIPKFLFSGSSGEAVPIKSEPSGYTPKSYSALTYLTPFVSSSCRNRSWSRTGSRWILCC